MAERKASLRGVVWFTAAYVVTAAVSALLTGNREFVFYLVVLLVIGAAIVYVHHRVSLSRGALWCLSVWGLAHMAGGLVPVPEGWPIEGDIRVLYSLWLVPGALKYDHLAHVYGYGVAAWVCWQSLRAITGIARPTLGLLVICGAAGLGFGALNEVLEFAATLTMEKTNVGGYVNTGWDLVSNLIGVVGAMTAVWLAERR